MFHYVHDQFSGSDQISHVGKGVRGLSVAQFEAQLDLLTSQLTPLDWATLSTGLRGKGEAPRQSFLLTFDDGLREHAEIVLPILKRRGLCGIFFVPGSVLAKPKMLCAHEIHLLIECMGEEAFAEAFRGALAEMNANCVLTEAETAEAHKTYHYEAPPLARLKFLLHMKLPLATRAVVTSRLLAKHVGPQEEWARRWYLTSEQVREIHAAGHVIGGHSFAHDPYARLSAETLERDIGRCAWSLRNILGQGERPFAYPFGSVHSRSADLLRAAGFTKAFGTQSTWLTRESQSMNLPRIDTIHVNPALQEATA